MFVKLCNFTIIVSLLIGGTKVMVPYANSFLHILCTDIYTFLAFFILINQKHVKFLENLSQTFEYIFIYKLNIFNDCIV